MSDRTLDTRTCGEADEDASLDRMDGPIARWRTIGTTEQASQPLDIPGTPIFPDACRPDHDPRAIVYNEHTHRYRAYHDNHIIGDFWTQHDADNALTDYARDLFARGLIDEPPFDGADPRICQDCQGDGRLPRWDGCGDQAGGMAETCQGCGGTGRAAEIAQEQGPTAIYARPAEPAPEAIEVKAGDDPSCYRCGAPIAYAVRVSKRSMIYPVCGECYLDEFVNDEERSDAWELLYCDNCPAPATTQLDLLWLCETCANAATDRLLAATRGPMCLSCGDPIDEEDAICEACQEAGEPWPASKPPAALTCEQCRVARPEGDFTAALSAPLNSPVICGDCLTTTVRQGLPVEPPAAMFAAPFVLDDEHHFRGELPADAWRHTACGRLFWTVVGASPLTCPWCELPADEQARTTAQRTVSGWFLLARYHDDPAGFLATFDRWCAQTQAAVTRAVAGALDVGMGDVDELWLESRLRLAGIGFDYLDSLAN